MFFAHGVLWALKNLEKAIDMTKNQFDFEHPFFLEPSAPKEGIRKLEFYGKKFGAHQFECMEARMTEIFQGLGGFEYDTSGLMRSSLDYHRLITFAANQGHDKQIALVDEFSLNYHCLGKYIGDRQVLLDAAEKVGIVGAAELLEDSNKGLKEVNEEFEKHSSLISGVPHFVIDGRYKLSCGQPPEVFLGGFQAVANDNSV